MNDSIRPEFEFFPDFTPVLVTSKFDEDFIRKRERERERFAFLAWSVLAGGGTDEHNVHEQK